MTTQDRTRELLRLARDACTGIAAFAALSTGDVIVVASPGETTPSLDARIVRLAEGVLANGWSHAGEKTWDAELPAEIGTDRIACVAVSVTRGDTLLAVLGVVDFLLPEIDQDLERILGRISADLATALGEAVEEPEPSEPVATRVVTEPEEAAPSSPTLLGAMVDHLPEGIVVARDDGTILYANQTFASLAHRGLAEILGGDLTGMLGEGPTRPGEGAPPHSVGRLLGDALGRRLALQLPGGRVVPVDVRGRRLEAGVVGECYAALVRDARQPIVGPVEVAGAAILEEVLDCIDDAVVVCDADERVVLANRAASRLLLLADGELAGRPFPFATELRSPEGAVVRYEDHPVLRALHGTAVVAEHLVLDDSADRRRHLLVSARPFGVAGSTGALLIAREITAQLDQEARLMQLALHDPLTGLANRYLLLDYLQRTFRQVRSRGGAMALLYLDLDDFKSINDTHGHDVGDEVLVAVAGRLEGATRGSDLVARLSGDEFVIVATAQSLETESIEVLLGRLRQVLSAPYHIRDHLLSVGASVGWVIADTQVEDPMTLLVRADEEMYRQKQARRTRRGSEAR